MAVLRVRPRGRPRRGDVQPHHHVQNELCRSQAWLADVLSRIAGHPAHRLDELAPWNWTPEAPVNSAQAA